MMKAFHIRLVHVANAQNGFFTSKLPCKLMIGTGQDIHAVHFRWLGDDSPFVAERLAAHFIHDAVDVFPDEAGNTGETGESMNDPGEALPHPVAIGVQKQLRVHALDRQGSIQRDRRKHHGALVGFQGWLF